MPGFALDGDFVRRVRAVVRWFEATPRNKLDSPGRGDRARTVRRAIVTTAITAGTSSLAGSGNAKLQQRNVSTGTYSDMQGPSGTVTVKVWNGYAGTVAVGKVIYVFRSGDDWELLTADCP